MDMKTSSDVSALRIDGSRLWQSLMELATIGATRKGGVCRLALTDLDKQGRDLVSNWARQEGMSVRSIRSATSSCAGPAATMICRR